MMRLRLRLSVGLLEMDHREILLDGLSRDHRDPTHHHRPCCTIRSQPIIDDPERSTAQVLTSELCQPRYSGIFLPAIAERHRMPRAILRLLHRRRDAANVFSLSKLSRAAGPHGQVRVITAQGRGGEGAASMIRLYVPTSFACRSGCGTDVSERACQGTDAVATECTLILHGWSSSRFHDEHGWYVGRSFPGTAAGHAAEDG